jgi:MFS family permease
VARATPAQIGLVPMLTQLGYAAGIVLFAPLGDRLDRRRVIVVKLLALAVALVLAGLAPSSQLLTCRQPRDWSPRDHGAGLRPRGGSARARRPRAARRSGA